MKKALSFAVALGLVAGSAAVASAAELTTSGDARWRGVYHTNFSDANDDTQDKTQTMDQRYRMKMDVKVNDAVKINTRLVFGDPNDGGNQVFDSSFTAKNTETLYADRWNMSIDTLGGTWTIGRQEVSWGNAPLPFLGRDLSADRIKGIYKVADMTLGAYLQQNIEGDNYGYVNGDGDQTTWGALAIGKAGDTSWGLLLNYVKDDSTAANSPNGKDKGYLVDPYFAAKVGPATLLGEFLYKGGKLYKNEDKARYGGYLAAVADVAPVTLTGLLAYSKNNLSADSHFAPSLLIGTTNDTAMINFGDLQTASDNTDRSILVAGVVAFKANDKLSFNAALGYLMASKHGYVAGDKMNLTEFDVNAEYELAQNAKYKFGIGYGDPKNVSAKDDAIWVIGNAVEVSW